MLASPQGDRKRSAVKAEAAQLLAELQRKDPTADRSKSAFAELAARRSDDAASKTLAGDLGLKSLEELTALWGTELASAAFSLKAVGDLTEVATDKGIHLIQLNGHQPGVEQTFAMARSRIESRLLAERRSRAVEELVATLKQRTKVEVDEAALNALDVLAEESKPAPAGAPPPAANR